MQIAYSTDITIMIQTDWQCECETINIAIARSVQRVKLYPILKKSSVA